MSHAISPQLLTSHKLYFEITSQTQSIAHASSRLFSGRIPELEWAAEIEPNVSSVSPSSEQIHHTIHRIIIGFESIIGFALTKG